MSVAGKRVIVTGAARGIGLEYCRALSAAGARVLATTSIRSPDDALHVFWARPGTPLKTVMLAMHRSQTSPVALFDDQSRFVGAIGIRDVLSAVLRR